MENESPASIVILPDGYAPCPQEACANVIPVLWNINNKKVLTLVENCKNIKQCTKISASGLVLCSYKERYGEDDHRGIFF